jgi:hypothetical protein
MDQGTISSPLQPNEQPSDVPIGYLQLARGFHLR